MACYLEFYWKIEELKVGWYRWRACRNVVKEYGELGLAWVLERCKKKHGMSVMY